MALNEALREFDQARRRPLAPRACPRGMPLEAAPKSMALGELAAHVANSSWLSMTLTTRSSIRGHAHPAPFTTVEALLAISTQRRERPRGAGERRR
jgi:hypothetical protein